MFISIYSDSDRACIRLYQAIKRNISLQVLYTHLLKRGYMSVYAHIKKRGSIDLYRDIKNGGSMQLYTTIKKELSH